MSTASPLLFETLPRSRPRIVRMHVIDCAMDRHGGEEVVQMACRKCGHRTGWITAWPAEAKRGISCPKCNEIA